MHTAVPVTFNLNITCNCGEFIGAQMPIPENFVSGLKTDVICPYCGLAVELRLVITATGKNLGILDTVSVS